ncbi:cytochrome P450 [Thozetella sp. PMI_491]|nr:cytochrome P450 [Thozetella sp. PMI_491]
MDVILSLPSPSAPALFGLVFATTVGFLAIYICFFYVDFARIKGIPEIPGGELLAGHLYQLGKDHATTAQSWSKKYGWPVFQLRMGQRRAIMLNSFEATRDWIVKNQSATIDRPWFYTFHGIVSKTSAATIGTSPWDERTKKRRRVVGSFTTAPSMQKMRKMLDMETCAVISGLYYDADKGATDISPHIYQKRLALNLMTMFCYGARFNSVTDPMLFQILKDAQTIASFRSTNSNAQDFIPHLRYLGSSQRTATAVEVRTRRDQWLAAMLENVRSNLTKVRPGDKKCVAEMLLEDSQEGLTPIDVKTILGGLMSGGFETIFSTVIITIGMLSTTPGQSIQEKAYEDIMGVYDTPEQAFNLCLNEEKSLYVAGLVKEALRVYPPLKILPARQVYKSFEYKGSRIPKGMLVYINTQAVNFDKATYGPDADQFRPERWTDKSRDVPPPYHFAFGAGARMCTAVNFSNRVLYALFVRLIIAFKMTESKEMPPDTDYIDYKEDPTAANAVASLFKVKFAPRDEAILERCLQQAHDSLEEFVAGDNGEPLVRRDTQ